MRVRCAKRQFGCLTECVCMSDRTDSVLFKQCSFVCVSDELCSANHELHLHVI